MKILIVGLTSISPQVVRLIEEGKKRGHQIEGCFTSELVLEMGNDKFKPTLRGREIDHDVVYVWAVGKRRWDWYTALYYLNKTKGTKIVNGKIIEKDYLYFLSSSSDYLKQVEAGLPFPKSAIIFNSKGVDAVISDFDFPLILKTSEGRQGRGVFKLNSVAEVKSKIKELAKISPSFVIREFIPNDGDIRIFTVGYRAIGAMKRTATDPGEFRSNISVGGKGEKYDLEKSPKVQEYAEKLSKITRTEIAGVDVMLHKVTGDPYILEINPGPQFIGFEKFGCGNAALEIIKYFEELHGNKEN